MLLRMQRDLDLVIVCVRRGHSYPAMAYQGKVGLRLMRRPYSNQSGIRGPLGICIPFFFSVEYTQTCDCVI